jgi:hypothetical protein
VTEALFGDALPAAGVADANSVEGQFLEWQDSRTVYRGTRGEVEPLVLDDLRHMSSEPGFKSFVIQTVEPQSAAEVMCFMSEQSRAGYLVAVPIRVWCTGERYVVSGIDESWKASPEAASTERDERLLEVALSDPYPVTVDYDLSLEATIVAGAYDGIADEYHGQAWSDWKSADGSPLERPTSGTAENELLLFHLEPYFGDGPYPTTEQILTAVANEGLVAETVDELLALGRDHPELQREFPIYELGSVWVRPGSDGSRFVAGLVADQRLRRLGLSSYLIQWPPQLRILVSRA